jgi:VWFA-related protein
VQVPVIVTEKNGRSVDGLVAHDFKLLDNGVPQPVSADDFDSGLAPISLAIAIQTAGISMPALAEIRRAGGMIEPLITGPGGEVAVVTFDSRIRWLQDFTRDDDRIRDAMTHLKAGSAMYQARMLDAIGEAAGRMQHRKGRKVLLLVSESRDRGSETSFQQAVEAVGREGIEVFGAHYSAYVTGLDAKPQDQPELPLTVVSGDPSDWPGSPPGVDFLAIFSEFGRLGKTNVVRMLTRVTGGFDYLFARERGIEDAIERLGAEVHSQYILSFPQAKSGAGLHRIEVSVPHQAGLLIRSRRTYWSAGSDVE